MLRVKCSVSSSVVQGLVDRARSRSMTGLLCTLILLTSKMHSSADGSERISYNTTQKCQLTMLS